MSVQNGERLVTKQDLKDFYDGILPYIGGISISYNGVAQTVSSGSVDIDGASNLITEAQWAQIQSILS